MRLGLWASELMALTLVTAVATSPTRADVIDFAYNGSNVFPGASGTTLGADSFSFAAGMTSLTLANLRSFSAVDSVSATQGGVSARGTFTYGLADLLTFSATVGPDDRLDALSLTTRPVASTNPFFFPETFVVNSLQPNGAGTYNFIGQQLTRGTVATAAVPEPSGLLLSGFAAAALGALSLARRRGA